MTGDAPKLPQAEPSETKLIPNQNPGNTGESNGEPSNEPRRPRNPRFGRKGGGKFGPKRPRPDGESGQPVDPENAAQNSGRSRAPGRHPHARPPQNNKPNPLKEQSDILFAQVVSGEFDALLDAPENINTARTENAHDENSTQDLIDPSLKALEDAQSRQWSENAEQSESSENEESINQY